MIPRTLWWGPFFFDWNFGQSFGGFDLHQQRGQLGQQIQPKKPSFHGGLHLRVPTVLSDLWVVGQNHLVRRRMAIGLRCVIHGQSQSWKYDQTAAGIAQKFLASGSARKIPFWMFTTVSSCVMVFSWRCIWICGCGAVGRWQRGNVSSIHEPVFLCIGEVGVARVRFVVFPEGYRLKSCCRLDTPWTTCIFYVTSRSCASSKPKSL